MKTILALTTILTAIALPAFAEEEKSFADSIPGKFSGSVAFTSDYMWRGLTQTDENPAVQGGFTYTIPLDDNFSVYAGIWGSNVEFNDANIELDFLTGVGYTDGNFALDTGLVFYKYPGADSSLNYDYYELQANIGYDLDPVYLRAAVNYSPDNAANSGQAVYVKLAADYKFAEDWKMTLRGGHQYIENNANYGLPDYNDYGIGITYTFKEVDLTAEYVANDIDSGSCGVNCDGKFLFTINHAF